MSYFLKGDSRIQENTQGTEVYFLLRVITDMSESGMHDLKYSDL